MQVFFSSQGSLGSGGRAVSAILRMIAEGEGEKPRFRELEAELRPIPFRVRIGCKGAGLTNST